VANRENAGNQIVKMRECWKAECRNYEFMDDKELK
jgi:hypothetical protein